MTLLSEWRNIRLSIEGLVSYRGRDGPGVAYFGKFTNKGGANAP